MDLIVFGTVFLEVVFGDMPALPGPGQEIYTDQFAFSIGGGAVTVATAASRLGVRAGMSALLGDDLGSRVAEQHCRRAGVDMTACRYVTGPVTGVSVAVNFDGDRAFISHLPPRPAGERRDTRRWLEVIREHRPRWCHVHAGPGVAPFVRQARVARRARRPGRGAQRHRRGRRGRRRLRPRGRRLPHQRAGADPAHRGRLAGAGYDGGDRVVFPRGGDPGRRRRDGGQTGEHH